MMTGLLAAAPLLEAQLPRPLGPRPENGLRIAPFFETAAMQYAWMNQIVAVGMGERVGPNVAYDLFEIL